MTKMSVIVVGAGSAGSVVARRVVDAGLDVTLLEAGGEDTNPAIHDLSRMGELWHGPDDWDYYTVPMAGTADEQFERYIRENVVTYHHQVGTCRMGSDADAVVDPHLRVNGIAGLRIIDASIMPQITTGNTNAPSILIGEKGARFLLDDLARG